MLWNKKRKIDIAERWPYQEQSITSTEAFKESVRINTYTEAIRESFRIEQQENQIFFQCQICANQSGSQKWESFTFLSFFSEVSEMKNIIHHLLLYLGILKHTNTWMRFRECGYKSCYIVSGVLS